MVPGAVKLNPLHAFQQEISDELRDVLTRKGADGRREKAMVELPTGAGKTRVATETVLRLFIEGELRGPVLWIAQSQELCEQAVQTWSTVWRGLGDERPLTIGRLWESNTVHEPDTEFSVIVATDAKLDVILGSAEYEWLSEATARHHRRRPPGWRFADVHEDPGLARRRGPRLGTASGRPLGDAVQGHVGDRHRRPSRARFGNHNLKAFEGNAYQELAELGVLARVKHEVLAGHQGELVVRRDRTKPAVCDASTQRSSTASVGTKHAWRSSSTTS